MNARPVEAVVVVASAVILAWVLLGFLNVIAPGCTDIAGESRSIFCLGGLGEPEWKRPLGFLLLAVLSGTAVRRIRREGSGGVPT